MTEADEWMLQIRQKAKAEKAKTFMRFFTLRKTGENFAAGDSFLGVSVPENREIAKSHTEADFSVIENLLTQDFHEYRLAALLALVLKYKKHRKADDRQAIINFYLAHTAFIDNWDFVDLSAPYIVGEHCLTHGNDIIERLSHSGDLWERRIAIVATLTLIRHGDISTTLSIARRYLTATEPLIHKATGWTLREVGKRDIAALHAFLSENAAVMPRIMLSYAIEKMTDEEKKHYRNMR